MDIDEVRRYMQLRGRQAELKTQMEAVAEEADELEQRLLDAYAKDSVSSMKVDGSTVYMRRELWARPSAEVPREQFIAAVKGSGLDHFVTESVNTNTLSAYVRELEKEEEALPPDLQEAVTVSEVFKLRIRRS